MNTEIIIALIGILYTVISSWVSWFLTRRKYNSEVDNTTIQNVSESLQFILRNIELCHVLSDFVYGRHCFFIDRNYFRRTEHGLNTPCSFIVYHAPRNLGYCRI